MFEFPDFLWILFYENFLFVRHLVGATRTAQYMTPSTCKRNVNAVVDLTGDEDDPPVAKKKRGRPPKRKDDVPGYLICPISHELMRVPVTIDSGHTYEHRTIFDWFRVLKQAGRVLRDPITKATVSDKLVPNFNIRKAIQKFLEENPTYTPEGWKTRDLPQIINIYEQAIKGDVDAIQTAFQHSPFDTNALNAEGQSLLFLAAAHGHVEVVKILLDKGATVDAQGADGRTALHIAAYEGHVEVVKMLLDEGAAIDAKNTDDGTALYIAALHEHVEVVKILLDKGADIAIDDWTALHSAAAHGHVEVVKILLHKGATIDAKNIDDWTALHSAAAHGHVEVVKILLHKGAAIDAKTTDDWTALHIAAEHGHVEVVKILLDEGAAIDAKTGHAIASLQEQMSAAFSTISAVRAR